MRLPTSAVVLSLALAAALPLRAQSIAAMSSDSASIRIARDTAQTMSVTDQNSEPAKGAAMTGLRAGVHTRETVPVDRPALAAAAGSRNLGRSRAMMIVGLAGLVSGAVIGGDAGTIIMVGGTIIGLVGLYEYLQ